MEEKKVSLYLLLSFVLNFCLTFTIIWTLGILLYLNIRLDEIRSSCPKCPSCDAVAPGTEDPAAVQKTPKSIDIEVNDNGFTNNSFQAADTDDITVILRNTGTMPHSFVIDDLGLNSQLVEAGNFKVIVIDSLPERTASYTFYSNAPRDEVGVFSGVLNVTHNVPAE
jgi:hypothetical protein